MAEHNNLPLQEEEEDDDDEDDEEEDTSDEECTEDRLDNVSRSKRSASGIAWCGVDTEEEASMAVAAANGTQRLEWPPKPEHRGKPQWVYLKSVQVDQPKFGHRMQLYSRTRHNVGVYYDGVRGTQDDSDMHTFLELSSAGGKVGHVRIQGMLTNCFIAMDHRGRLYSEPNHDDEATIFIETIRGLYNQYMSAKYKDKGWYLAIKKNGKFKRGPKTGPGQKATQFLPRRRRFE